MAAKHPTSGLALIVMTAIVLLLASPALTATYYVSQYGNDFYGDGSEGNPWETISKADSIGLQPGDVVIVSGNFVWDDGQGDLQVSSGTPEAPITYISTDAAKIESLTRPAIKIYGSTVSNIVIDGFEITGGPIELAEGADNITIRNCYIHDIDVFAYHETLSGVYCKINMLSGGSSGCRIERNILGDMSETPKYDWAIGQVQTSNLLIYNNTIVNGCVALCDAGGAIGQPGSDGTVMKNNIIQKMWYSAIALYGSTNFVHSHNIYWDTNGVYDAGGVAMPDATELNADPLFVGGTPFDYHLSACSPAVNAGTDVGLPGSIGVPDIGRYESPYTGEEGRITGKVTKSTDGSPIQGATVELVGLSESTTTDASGNYQFCALAPGSYTVRASYPGASPSEAEVEVAQSSTVIQNFVLTILAKTYYVTPNGDNGTNGDGSLEHPWKQIDYGDVNGLLYPGDTVLVQPGTYTYENGNFSSASGVIISNCSGAPGNPITYKANGSGVKIVRTNQVAQSGIRVNSPAVHDIVIDGFDVSGAMLGIRIAAADRITVKNCYIHDANIPNAVNGIALAAVSGEQSEDCLFINNVISNLQGNQLGGGIALYTGIRTKVYHNTIDTVGVGMWLIYQSGLSSYEGVQFKNNISANCTYGIAIQQPGAAVWQYNCYWNNQINNGGGGVGEFVGDPMFVGGDPYDYHLQQGSKAIDMGTELGYPYQGTAPDCGAFESPYVREGITYHVTPDGWNGTNGDGSLERPWKLIDYGDATGILRPNDTVLVHAGTYGPANVSQIGVQLAWCSGKPGYPITYKAEPGAVIDMQGAEDRCGFADQYWGPVVPQVHDIVIDGFEIANCASGVVIAGGARITVKNCYIHGAGTNSEGNVYGIEILGIPSAGYNSDDCFFHNNVIANLTNTVTGQAAISIGTHGGTNRTRAYNNTMDAADYAWYMVKSYGPNVDWQWTNNIVTNMRQWIYATDDFSQFHYQYNLFWGNPANVMGGLGDVVADPQFVGGEPFSYALTANSPAVDAGIDVGLSFQGLAPDMGAIESAYTGGTEYASLVDVKSLTPGSAVRITEPKIVTASSATFADGSYYVEEPNRVSGLKVKPEVTGLPSVIPGDAITMLGVVRVDANGETYLGLHDITKSVGTALKPIGTSGVGAAYSRLAGSGILVRTWGLVTKVTSNYIYVDDGTGYDDGSGNGKGIRIVISGL
ncbi:MAG: right-handed parallel beta-helix repeat-containing protein, partial [Armatimonadota bacterium]